MPKRKMLKRLFGALTMSVVLIWPIGVLAVPPANGQGVIHDLQVQINDLQSQIDNSQAVGTRISAVDGSAQTVSSTGMDLSNEETFISLPVATTTDGTFVMGFSSMTSPALCPVGTGGPCGDIRITQSIYLDGQLIGTRFGSPRVFDTGGGLDKYITQTVSANNISAGGHTIEVRVSCRILNIATDCVTQGYMAAARFDTLWAIHPK
jgi:hypothetical protein